MKFSIAATVLILALGGALGWNHNARLSVLRAEQQQLAARASSLGIAPSGDEARSVKRPRVADAASAAMIAEMVTFIREMEIHQNSGGVPDEAFQKRGAAMMERLMNLNAAQLKDFVDAMREADDLPADTRRSMLAFSIQMLAEDHPAAALGIFSNASDLLGDHWIGSQVLANSLGRWASEDPTAAVEWLRRNSATHPDLADDDAKRHVIAGSALADPQLAFKLIGELQLDDPSAAIDAIVETAKTTAQRTAILTALRENLATVPDAMEREETLGASLESMGRNLSGESFDAVQLWLSSAKLSPEESAKFSAGLSYDDTGKDTGRWIDWMASNLPEDAVRENTDNLIGQWTQQDYLAAGNWLTATPEGPAKNAAVATYAETVAEYEPQVAEQWAMTLPEGKQRQETLTNIYRNWPEEGKEAAAAFAKEHGIDTEAAREGP